VGCRGGEAAIVGCKRSRAAVVCEVRGATAGWRSGKETLDNSIYTTAGYQAEWDAYWAMIH
jgi:hypothetical protein